MAVYEAGSVARIEVTFYSQGVLVTPAAISLSVRDPTENETVYTLAGGDVLLDGTSAYHDVVNVTEGTWRWSCTSSNPTTVVSGEFVVIPRASA